MDLDFSDWDWKQTDRSSKHGQNLKNGRVASLGLYGNRAAISRRKRVFMIITDMRDCN